MPLLTIDQLDRAVPNARFENLVLYHPYLEEGLGRFRIDTPLRISAFLAQVAHESAEFNHVEENLNYGWVGLRLTWPKRFPTDDIARRYERNKEKIANYVYADRNGNGSEASGDGWRFRGRGLIQVTGRGNYTAYANAVAEPGVLADPALLAQPRHAAISACWYWNSRNLNTLADKNTETAFHDISHTLNGGWNGKADRLENWAEAKQVLMA
jgi:putative chitinase